MAPSIATGLTLAGALALLLAGLVLRRRAARIEDDVWSLMVLGVAIIAVAATATAIIDAVTSGPRDDAGTLVFWVGAALACGPFYLALVHWNRARIGEIDPGESVNGISALLAVMAVANLALPYGRQHAASLLAQVQLQAAVWAAASLFVVFGTALSVLLIANLRHDLRIWLLIGGFVVVLVAQGRGLVVGPVADPTTRALWLALAAAILLCILIPPREGVLAQVRQTNQGTIYGALTVLLACLVILAVASQLGGRPDRLTTGYAVLAAIGGSIRLLRLVQDLAHLARTRHEAMTDELTGLANRRALLSAIDDALPTARTVSLLIIDLDRFKAINDRYGHDAGDQVLRHMADTFAAQIPDGGILARLGGDEFAVLLIDVGPALAARVGDSLAAAAAPLSDVKGRILQVGASVGVTTLQAPGIQGRELLRQADAAMYLAKTSGSGVRLYDGEVDALAQEQLTLIEDLHLALEGPARNQWQIVVYFQPQLDAAGQVAGAEALVRWEHPRLGLLAPDAFIELAEQNELMMSLTARVMRETAGQAARWRAAGYPLRASVNLSASCLANPLLLTLLREVLDGGMPAGDLVLEVTETSLMKDPERALAALNRIAERGVGISIDDYGTGYSSLSYLNDLPATELKIDKSFIARLTRDPRTAAIVAGTVDLAHRLGLRLIAEGVEDDETLAMVRKLGCDETQGYLHSRPLPSDVFLNWLSNTARTRPSRQEQNQDARAGLP